MRNAGLLALALILLAATSLASASGGSYLVDDASVAPAGHCQLESWLQAYAGGGRSGWSTPACGVGPVEFGLGLGHATHPSANAFNPSVKWQLRNGDDAGWGVALATDTTIVHGRREGSNVYAATTFGLDDARHLLLDVNLGAAQTVREPWRRLVGIGAEYAMTGAWSVLGERLWTAGTSHVTQWGVRYSFGDNSVDLVSGSEHARRVTRWSTLGLNLAF